MQGQRKDNYLNRFSQMGLTKDQLERKWRARLAEEQMMQLTEAFNARGAASQQASAAAVAGGSSKKSGSLEFVVDTSDYTDFRLVVEYTGGSLTGTVDWGDGTIEQISDQGDSGSLNHDFPESENRYTVKMDFDDPSVITRMDFIGDD